MALQSSGAISLNDIHIEAGGLLVLRHQLMMLI